MERDRTLRHSLCPPSSSSRFSYQAASCTPPLHTVELHHHNIHGRKSPHEEANQQPNASKGLASEPTKKKVTSLTKGKWKPSIVACAQLDWLSEAGYLPVPELAFARSPLISQDGNVWSETVPKPNPEDNERVCLVPFLLNGLGFPIHPSLGAFFIFTVYNSLCYVKLFSTVSRTSACG